MASNDDLIGTDDLAARIAAQTMAKRGADYATEVRRLLDAALDVIGRLGTTSRARVADIVAAAGLSNDAFYRHFASKDALVAALLEDGTTRLVSYVAHQMTKEPTPEGQVKRWVAGVFSQTDERTAATTLAVVWNGSTIGSGFEASRHSPAAALAPLLHEPFVALGCATPGHTAVLVAHAVIGRMSDHLWERERPSRDELERVTRFAIAAATAAGE